MTWVKSTRLILAPSPGLPMLLACPVHPWLLSGRHKACGGHIHVERLDGHIVNQINLHRFASHRLEFIVNGEDRVVLLLEFVNRLV